MWKALLRLSRCGRQAVSGGSAHSHCMATLSVSAPRRNDTSPAAAPRQQAADRLSDSSSAAAEVAAAAAAEEPAEQSEPGPSFHLSSLKEILHKVRSYSSSDGAAGSLSGDSRLAATVRSLSDVVAANDPYMGPAAGALSNLLQLVSSSGYAGLAGDAASVLGQQPLALLFEVARRLEADDATSGAAEKKQARKPLLAALKEKAAATADATHLISALRLCNAVEDEVYDELRDVAELAVQRLASQMDGPALCRVLHLLAVSTIRQGKSTGGGGAAARSHNLQLMRTLAYHASRRRFLLTGQQLANTLYACSLLGLHDQRLLARLDEVALFAVRRDRLQVSVLSSVILSLGKLRWDSPALMDALCSRCADIGIAAFKPFAAATLFHTCAQLSYVPSSFASIVDDVLRRVAISPDLFLDAVWSLVVLGVHSADAVSKILNPSFVQSLDEVKLAGHKKVYNDLKLLNIAFAAARNDKEKLDSLHKTLFSRTAAAAAAAAAALPSIPPVLPKEKSAAALADDIASVLAYVAPKSTHQNRHIMTVAGHDIDIELLVDSNGQPKPLHDYVRPYARAAAGAAGRSKQATSGWQWVAIKVLGYHDILFAPPPEHSSHNQNDETLVASRSKPLGRHALAVRQLTELGYSVVTIDYKEYYVSGAESTKKLDFLRNKIAACLH